MRTPARAGTNSVQPGQQQSLFEGQPVPGRPQQQQQSNALAVAAASGAGPSTTAAAAAPGAPCLDQAPRAAAAAASKGTRSQKGLQ
eukprot:1157584-Pelagomonas_calceolata.AAC.3